MEIQQEAKEVEFLTTAQGKDLDKESTTQNFLNVARQGDLSPRHMEQGKSAAKGRKKQGKDPSTTTAGVQTRRALTKSSN